MSETETTKEVTEQPVTTDATPVPAKPEGIPTPAPEPIVIEPAATPTEFKGPLANDPALQAAQKRIAEQEAAMRRQSEEAAKADPYDIAELKKQIAKIEGEKASLSAEISKLKKRVQDEDGARGAEIQKLRSTVATQLQTIETLNSKISELKAAKPEVQSQIPEAVSVTMPNDTELRERLAKRLPAELLDTYGEALPFVREVADEMVRSAIEASMKKEPKKAEKSEPAEATTAAPQEQSSTQQQSFSDADRKLCLDIETLCPGFIREVQPLPMGGTLNPEWVSFLKSPINENSPNELWASKLDGFVTPEQCADVYRAYIASKSRRDGTQPAQPQPQIDGRPNSLSDLASPKTMGASTQPSAPEKVYRLADYERLKREAADPKNVARFPEMKRQLLEYQQALANGTLRA